MDSKKVVVCGMSGRLPESDTLEELWNHLINKDDLVNRDDRKWDSEYLGLPKGSALLKDLSRFDAAFFGMLPKQVNKTDPQLRILLEVAYEAIIDAGFNAEELKGSNTGVYVASSYADASVILTEDMQATDGFGFLACLPAMLANRVSYVFDLKGPSYTSCAACASGLVVLQNAMKDILAGECDYALVCGVTTNLRPQVTYSMRKLGVLSPNGESKPFDESADGFVRADAVVAVFITRDTLCRRAYCELIHAVTNHCGYQEEGIYPSELFRDTSIIRVGISFPSLDAQTDLLRRAYGESGIPTEEVEFMEAHATATPTGDPIETNAIHRVFGHTRSREKPLLIGTIKGNMGHAECTAGLASLLKVLLTINHGIIPPNINFHTPKSTIKGLQDGTLKVVTEPTRYKGGPIGINSFGFGGVNVHMIVKPYYVSYQNHPCDIPRILFSSGRTKECVRHNLKYLADNMTEGIFHRLSIQVAEVPPESMPYRGYKILKGGNLTEEVNKVAKFGYRPVWFIFTGTGSQWPGMGKDLMALETFRKTILRCHEFIEATDPDIQLVDLIMNGTKEKVDQTKTAYVASTSIQIALVNCLKELGIQPSGLIGHSVGETSCAFADGLMTEEQTILAAYWRARYVVEGNLPPGRMASVGLGWEEVKARIPEGAVAACQNAEDNTTVSGNADVIKGFVSALESEGVFTRKVNTNGIAYHSPDIHSVAPVLQAKLDEIIKIQTPRSPSWISTSVSDDQTESKETKWFSSSYLVKNLTSPVLFYDAVCKVPPNAVVIELGPHGLLEALVKRSLHADSVYFSLTNRKAQDNLHYFMSQIGNLFNLGLSLDVEKLYPPVEYPLGTGTPMLSPGIKWDHSQKWYVPSWEEFMTSTSSDRSVTIKEIDLVEGGSDSFVKDHNIDGRVLYPATGYIVTAWRAIADMMKTLPEKVAIDFSDVKIHRATLIPNSGKVTLTVRVVPSINLFDISENDEVTVSGRYSIPEEPFVPGERSKVDEECYIVNMKDFYKELRLIGYNYGPKFQGVVKSTLDGNEAVLAWNGNWISFLDTMLQVTVFGKANPSKSLYLPTRIRSLRINPKYHAKENEEGLDPTEIPVTVNRVMDTTCSGGVEIAGLHTSMAPKKQVNQTVTLESVEFVPYGKVNVSLPKNVVEYGEVCREYLLNCVLEVQEENPLQETDLHGRVKSFLSEDDSGFLTVLQEIGKLNGKKDLKKDIWDIIDGQASELANDKLLSYLPKSPTFKNLLDVVWENSTTRKLKVTELCARYGGLFIHTVPCMTSQPLLEFEFIATDTDLTGLSKAFQSQLNALNVTTSFFDINGEDTNGLDHIDLVVMRGLAQQSRSVLKSLQKIHSVLNDGGFLLLHEVTSNFDLHLGFDDLIFEKSSQNLRGNLMMYLKSSEWEDAITTSGFDIFHEEYDGFSSTLFLCRKKRSQSSESNVFIPVSGRGFEWVETVKTELSNLQDPGNRGNIWLVSDNDYQSGIVGLVNCLRQEDGGDRLRCIFNTSDLSEESLLKIIIQADLVMNVLKDGKWGSYRHQFLDRDRLSVKSQDAYVNIVTRGDLSSLQWIQLPLTNNHTYPSQVTCNVVYSSLNFKDVMLATGKLPAGSIPDNVAHRECLIGIEFAGLDPNGRRVMGIVASQGLATQVTTESEQLFDVPESWSLEEAATVPVVYSTVYYALVVRGQVKRGESILIHSGSGGVGQAAIAVALSHDCKVYTTVGTEEKRQFLKKKFPALTDDCFANSRDLSFEKHVMKETNGAGVDLVLNSLSGEKLEASLRCLSTNGRFLEIGKYDLSQNNQIGLSIFLKNTAFHGIHLDNLFERGNPEWSIVANLMKQGLRDGVVQPLPSTAFSRHEVEDAFRYMAKGIHIGKVLIKVSSEEEVARSSVQKMSVKPRHSCHPDKVYIIVGGLGGFGLELADWLVSRNCKRLVLTSRSGVKTGYHARCVRRWESLGVIVNVSKIDISESQNCLHLLGQCQKMGPIGGIFNLAMVLKDALIENLTAEDFKEVCKPKVDVANNLDEATRQLCGSELDWFVMFSSVTSGRGNRGQSNYGYANSAMERLCERRREDQLPGLAIQWGVIGDVGVVADSKTGDDTVISGCEAQKIQSCLSTLDLFLSYPHPVLSSFVRACQDKKAATENSTIDIAQFVSKFFGIADISSVSPEITLAELGLDSLMAVEVKQTLERDFSTILSMREIRALSLRKLLNQFGEKGTDTKEEGADIKEEKVSDNKKENDDNVMVSTVTRLQVTSPILSCKTMDCLVQLNAGHNGAPPIFLIHPIEGSIDVFRPLAKLLCDHTVYALQATIEVPDDSVVNIAKYYLLRMRSVQPEGPYNIAGYSFGALVALEIVLLLQEQEKGTAKSKLMLLDASPNFIYTLMRFILDTKYQLHEAQVQVLGTRAALEVQTLLYLVTLFTEVPLNEMRGKLLDKPNYEERLRLTVSTALAVKRNIDREDMTFSIESFVKRTLAILAYQPESTWEIDMVLLKAKSCNKELLERIGSVDYNLSKICSGEITVHTIEGDHQHILQDPGLQEVATIMKSIF